MTTNERMVEVHGTMMPESEIRAAYAKLEKKPELIEVKWRCWKIRQQGPDDGAQIYYNSARVGAEGCSNGWNLGDRGSHDNLLLALALYIAKKRMQGNGGGVEKYEDYRGNTTPPGISSLCNREYVRGSAVFPTVDAVLARFISELQLLIKEGRDG